MDLKLWSVALYGVYTFFFLNAKDDFHAKKANEPMWVVRKHFSQKLNDEFKGIANAKTNRLFYKINPAVNFKGYQRLPFIHRRLRFMLFRGL